MRFKSSIIEYVISSLSEEDMNNLLINANEEIEENKILAFSSYKFKIRDYELLDIKSNSKKYIVTYLQGTKPIPQIQAFNGATIVQEGYEPTKLIIKNNKIKVTFEKTDWYMQ